MPLEYRICWNAGSNISFRGATDWDTWDEDSAPDEVLGEPENNTQPSNLPPGLDIAIEASGFDWWIETREMSARARKAI
jgi:hypothetical protein